MESLTSWGYISPPTPSKLLNLMQHYSDHVKSKGQSLTPKLASKLLALLLSCSTEVVTRRFRSRLTETAKCSLSLMNYFLRSDKFFQDAVENMEASDFFRRLGLEKHLEDNDEAHVKLARQTIEVLRTNFPKFSSQLTKFAPKEEEIEGVEMEARPDHLPPQGMYYDTEATEVLKLFKSDPKTGLTSEEATKRLETYGQNVLPQPPPISPLKILWGQITDFMVLILLVVTIISAAQQDWIEAAVLLIVVVMNVGIGFYQELKAENALLALKKLVLPTAKVIRDSAAQPTVIGAEKLVPGDVVVLEEGDTVPADLRLINASNLNVIEALLTGESEPILKNTDAILHRAKVSIGDRRCMSFMSTSVTKGRGLGLVVSTGKQTEVGKISEELARPVQELTALQRRLARLGKILVLLSVILCALVVAIGLIRVAVEKSVMGSDVSYWIKVGVALAVSVIPEGLVAVTTVTMAVGVQRMATRNAIVRRLPAVETIGSLTTICSDKTGTLTEGKMSVCSLWAGFKNCYDSVSTSDHPILPASQGNVALERMLMIASLCNHASLGDESKKHGAGGGGGGASAAATTGDAYSSGVGRIPSSVGSKSNGAAADRSSLVSSSSPAPMMSTMSAEVAMVSRRRQMSVGSHETASASGLIPLSRSHGGIASPSSPAKLISISGGAGGGGGVSGAGTGGPVVQVSTVASKSSASVRSKSSGSPFTGSAAKIAHASGDPVEIALLVTASSYSKGRPHWEAQGRVIGEAPFDSDRKRMSVLFRPLAPRKGSELRSSVDVAAPRPASNGVDGPPSTSSPSSTSSSSAAASAGGAVVASLPAMILCKGAVEVVVQRCSRYMSSSGELKKLTPGKKGIIEKKNNHFAERGQRVLGVAFREVSASDVGSGGDAEVAALEEDMVFIGLISMIDPPRRGVKETIAQCREAGIRVCMITGDHHKTAFAIAKQLGLCEDPDMVVTGAQLDAMQMEDLAALDPMPIVFARVSPANKLQIVQALRERGEVCAMTGDGVNDAPAIKRANVGIAMGLSATDLTKDSADIILTNDEFSTIAAAVLEGRRIYDNIVKFVMYLLSCNSAEIYVMFFATLTGLEIPFSPVMILWANLVADVPPALCLGVDPAAPDLMQRPPRDPKQDIFTRFSLARFAFYGLSMAFTALSVYSSVIHFEIIGRGQVFHVAEGVADRARTICFISLTMAQLFHSFVQHTDGFMLSREFISNPLLNISVFFSVIILVAGCYIPGLNHWLEMYPLDGADWGKCLLAMVIHLIFAEVFKFCSKYFFCLRPPRRRTLSMLSLENS